MNGAPDLFARLCHFTELRLHVEPDHSLGCVEISVDGLPGDSTNLVMAPSHAIDFAGRLIAACTSLRRAEQHEDQPPSGSPGPFSSTY